MTCEVAEVRGDVDASEIGGPERTLIGRRASGTRKGESGSDSLAFRSKQSIDEGADTYQRSVVDENTNSIILRTTRAEPEKMQLLYYSLALYLSTLSARDPVADAAPAKDTVAPQLPCTIRSPTSGAFFDLSPLHIEDPALSKLKYPRDYSWNTTGWNLPYNFTMNFCGPVVEELEDVVGVPKANWGNVSAYYKEGGKVYSIG